MFFFLLVFPEKSFPGVFRIAYGHEVRNTRNNLPGYDAPAIKSFFTQSRQVAKAQRFLQGVFQMIAHFCAKTGLFHW
jgi:hypothetical protein